MSDQYSRPKIHRLPATAPVAKPREPLATLSYCLQQAKLYFVACGLVLTVTLAAILMQSGTKNTQLIAREPGYPTAVSEASASSLPTQPMNKTLVFNGQDEKIVGQMAKIPAESEQGANIETISKVDNHAGRELLSIINKY